MKHATKPLASRNFHLPLPEELRERLRLEAARSGRPATALAREAIESWLAERRRVQLHQSIADYASRFAGSALDLDAELEAASVEHLQSGSRRRKKSR